MGLLGRIFGRRSPRADFVRHIPVLAQASHDISLGIYWRLSKRYENEITDVDPHTLAYAVVYDLTQNDNGSRDLGDFPAQNRDLIAQRAGEAARDEAIRQALSLEYAGRVMAQSWKSSNSSGAIAAEWVQKVNRSVDRASTLGIEIANIMSIWGPQAIVNLAAFAKEFREQSL